MSFSMTPLLMHSPDLSISVREALAAAYNADPEDRAEHLQLAAQLLRHETQLECSDVKELIGMPDGSCA